MALTARGDDWLCGLCSSLKPESPHETAARLRKAFAIADVLTSVGGDPAALGTMTEADWDLAARGAGVGIPSAQTRVEVAKILEQRGRRAEAAHA